MTGRLRRAFAVMMCLSVTVTGCSFQGVNSLTLPGVAGFGPGAATYHVEIANVGTLESNSPVMIDNVVVGSVGRMTFDAWHADVEVSVRPGVTVPANAVASIGQTSLLGSMHLALDPPLGEAPHGHLEPGATLPLNQNSRYPSTEETLAALSMLVNAGGLGKIGDIVHNLGAALSGRENEARELLGQMRDLMGTLDTQRDNIVSAINGLNRLSTRFAEDRDTISDALDKIPPALDILIAQRPRITEMLRQFGYFSDSATSLISRSQDDIVTNLRNLEPILKALADIGPDLDQALAYLTTFPFPQNVIDRGVRGDYLNLFAQMDLTIPRLKSTLFLGTRWGQEGAVLVPAPGEPDFRAYTYDPLTVGVNPPSPSDAPVAPDPNVPVDPSAPSGGG